MRTVKIIAILLLVYVGIVASFESLLGYFQPTYQTVVVLTTTDADGTTHDRVVDRLESNGQVYVAVNHWPRAWYRRALANPELTVTSDRERRAHLAIPVSGEEHDRVNSDNPTGVVFRFLTGFPPRYFLRLDPR